MKKSNRKIILTPDLKTHFLNELKDLDYKNDFSGLVDVKASENKTAVVFYGNGSGGKFPGSKVIEAFQVGTQNDLFACMGIFIVPSGSEMSWEEVLKNVVFDPVLARQIPQYRPFLRDIYGNRISRIIKAFLNKNSSII